MSGLTSLGLLLIAPFSILCGDWGIDFALGLEVGLGGSVSGLVGVLTIYFWGSGEIGVLYHRRERV